MDDPNGWEWGPPKSESESWRCHRRDELLGTATTILMGRMRIRAAVDGDDWKQHDDDAEAQEVEAAVRIAKKIIARVEQEIPRA